MGPEQCFEYISQVQVKAKNPTDNLANCENLRESIYEKLISAGHITANVSINRIRIREKMDQRLAKVVRAETLLRELSIHTNKEFVAQILDEDENPSESKDQVLVYVQKFDRSRWALGKRVERAINLDSRVCDIGQQLASEFNIQDPAN